MRSELREAIKASAGENKWRRRLIVVALSHLVLAGQTQMISRIIERRLCLANLQNYSYTIVFPKLKGEARYSGKSGYLYSVVSPNGRSLFAVRREFDSSGRRQLDTLIRREVSPAGMGPEEVISTPFDNVFQCAPSQNEKFIAIAGRPRRNSTAKDTEDGVFLFDRDRGSIQYLAPYNNRSEDIHSLNVNDHGDLVLYEDKGTILTFATPSGQPTLINRHPGRLPVLLPEGQGYIYSDRGQLILADGTTKHQLFSAPNVVGGIRLSPDAHFVAFGVDLSGDLSSSQLKVCELNTLACVDGPKYSDWIAGRETFWIKE